MGSFLQRKHTTILSRSVLDKHRGGIVHSRGLFLAPFNYQKRDSLPKKSVVKKASKGNKKGCFSGYQHQDLTKIEQEVLHLLTYEFLTRKQIALRRQCSRQAIDRIIRNLKKKGVLNKANKSVVKNDSTMQHGNHPIRLHGQEFNIKLLFKDHRYNDIMKKRSNVLYVDGNRVHLYKNSLRVFSGHSFYADDCRKATAKSFKYWDKFFVRLENDLKIIIIKPRYQNIRVVNHHYAEVNNELSKDCEKKGEKIRVYTNDDGKLWFTIDNSFNLHEAETQHPETAEHDGDNVKRHFNDIRDNKPPTLSEVMVLIKQLTEQNMETAAGLNAVVKLMSPVEKRVNELEKRRPDYIG